MIRLPFEVRALKAPGQNAIKLDGELDTTDLDELINNIYAHEGGGMTYSTSEDMRHVALYVYDEHVANLWPVYPVHARDGQRVQTRTLQLIAYTCGYLPRNNKED